jgi:hypothetical protein
MRESGQKGVGEGKRKTKGRGRGKAKGRGRECGSPNFRTVVAPLTKAAVQIPNLPELQIGLDVWRKITVVSNACDVLMHAIQLNTAPDESILTL